MANCGLCSKELKFMNTPVLGVSKLSSGETLCSTCYTSIVKAEPFIKLGKITLDEVKSKLENNKLKKEMTAGGGKPVEKSRIDLQLEKIGFAKSFMGRREVAELPKIIGEDEEIFALVQGNYNEKIGILVATNKRLLFVDKGLIYGMKVEDFGLDKITSIQYETGILFGEIKILASGNTAKISQVTNAEAKTFSEKVRAKLSETKKTTSHTVINQPLDVADQLLKLSKLKDQGILTQEEFDTQKQKLLNG